MGDFFDLNNDGNLDFFEESMKISHINNCLEYIEKEQEQKEAERINRNNYYNSSNNQGKTISWGMSVLIIIGLIIVNYLLFKLLLAM
ncbi:hypothetical protein SAMN06297422_11591 [Lachnospiraceae bacterium]|nr:hypothetical protein SAMN06297422_11591 [Lachnospiraceae bacterium]